MPPALAAQMGAMQMHLRDCFDDSLLTRTFTSRVGRGARDGKAAMTILISELHKTVASKSKTLPLEKLLKRRGVVEVLDRNMPCDGYLEPIGTAFSDGFRLALNPTAPSFRKRFTTAHELCHSFFYEYVPEMKFIPHDTDSAEELVCNHGAAELLMPARSLCRMAKPLPVCLSSLESLARQYSVSREAMALRLRSLQLWKIELSSWALTTSGTFSLDKITGGRRIDWKWMDQTPILDTWETGQSRSGRTFVGYVDSSGTLRVKPVSYELQRRNDRVIALWGGNVVPSKAPMPLFEQKR